MRSNYFLAFRETVGSGGSQFLSSCAKMLASLRTEVLTSNVPLTVRALELRRSDESQPVVLVAKAKTVERRSVAGWVGESVLLEEVTSELREVERSTGISRVLAVGELILERFFGGDPTVWRDRRRNKNNSIRRLAAHKDCPFGKTWLNEAVAVYVAVQASPCVRTYGHITAGHVAAVLPLAVEEREALWKQAEAEGWSVKRLKEEAVEDRRKEGERRGRPRLNDRQRARAAFRAAVARLELAIEGLGPEGTQGADEELCGQVAKVRLLLEGLR